MRDCMGTKKRVASIPGSPLFSHGVNHKSVQGGGWAVDVCSTQVYPTIPLPSNPSLGIRTLVTISRSVATIYTLQRSLLAVGWGKRKSISTKHSLSSSRTHRNLGGRPKRS